VSHWEKQGTKKRKFFDTLPTEETNWWNTMTLPWHKEQQFRNACRGGVSSCRKAGRGESRDFQIGKELKEKKEKDVSSSRRDKLGGFNLY